MNEYVVSINRKKVNEQLNDPSLWVPSDAAAAAAAADNDDDNDDDDDTMFLNTNAPICLWIVLLVIICP